MEISWRFVVVALLVVAGATLIVLSARKLIEDWPRLKPVHNVDRLWVQVYVGLTLFVIAWFLATDPTHKLREKVPSMPLPPDKQDQAAAAADSRSR